MTEDRIDILNKQLVEDINFDSTFKKINSNTCKGIAYVKQDPRLFNPFRGTYIPLDKPPFIRSRSNTDCIDKEYKSYSDINRGNIIYYTDKKNQDPFDNPLFSEKGKTVIKNYTDLNGNLRCQYDYVSDKKCCGIETGCDVSGEYCLSSIRDSQIHREDIISRQMRPYNERIFNPLCKCNTIENN